MNTVECEKCKEVTQKLIGDECDCGGVFLDFNYETDFELFMEEMKDWRAF